MNEESKFDRLPDFSQLLEHAPKLFCMVYRTSALTILLVIAIQHPENGALILERVTDEIIEPLDGFAQIAAHLGTCHADIMHFMIVQQPAREHRNGLLISVPFHNQMNFPDHFKWRVAALPWP